MPQVAFVPTSCVDPVLGLRTRRMRAGKLICRHVASKVSASKMWRAQLLDSFLGKDGSGRVLVHVDEHKKVSADPQLRKAALDFISEDPRVLTIATYIADNVEVSKGTARQCRFGLVGALSSDSPRRMPCELAGSL
eukprot:s321_g17.t1